MTPNRIPHWAALALAVTPFAFAPLGATASTTLYHDNPAAYALGLATAGLGGSVVNGDLTAAAAAHGVTPQHPYGVGDPDAIAVGSVNIVGNNAGNAAGFLIDTDYRINGVFYSHQIFNGAANALTFQFAAPVLAFSFVSNVLNFTITGAPGAVPLTLTTSNGDVVNTTTTPYYFGGDVNPPEAAPVVFNGLVSSSSFTSLTMATTAQAFDITSFAFALAPVPEPGSSALMLAGLAGIAGLLRRRMR